jgi:hypothetical protein
MLARISNLDRSQLVRITLLVCIVCGMAACVHETPPLIADPNGGRETALPWNEQTKWERDGSAAGLNTAGRR